MHTFIFMFLKDKTLDVLIKTSYQSDSLQAAELLVTTCLVYIFIFFSYETYLFNWPWKVLLISHCLQRVVWPLRIFIVHTFSNWCYIRHFTHRLHRIHIKLHSNCLLFDSIISRFRGTGIRYWVTCFLRLLLKHVR